MSTKNNTAIALNKKSVWKQVVNSWQLYVLLLPAILFIVIYRYGPMYGLQLAFKDYQFKSGIMGSPWAGFKHFERFFSYYRFKEILINTIVLAFYKLLVGFPMPIILALALNEVRNLRVKKFVQTVTYAPYFISVVVVVGITMQMFSPHYGILASFIRMFSGETVDVMTNPQNFRHIFVWTEVWQLTGYQAILYIAALSAIPSEQYEAAVIDGATKFQRIIHIDIPSILPTATILLILEMGRMMNISFEKVILLQNPLNLRTSEILTTYLYKVGILDGYFDFATAGTLFNSVINFLLVVTVNSFARRLGETSLW